MKSSVRQFPEQSTIKLTSTITKKETPTNDKPPPEQAAARTMNLSRQPYTATPSTSTTNRRLIKCPNYQTLSIILYINIFTSLQNIAV